MNIAFLKLLSFVSTWVIMWRPTWMGNSFMSYISTWEEKRKICVCVCVVIYMYIETYI